MLADQLVDQFALSIPKAEKYHYYYYLEVLFLSVLIVLQYVSGPISGPIHKAEKYKYY